MTDEEKQKMMKAKKAKTTKQTPKTKTPEAQPQTSKPHEDQPRSSQPSEEQARKLPEDQPRSSQPSEEQPQTFKLPEDQPRSSQPSEEPEIDPFPARHPPQRPSTEHASSSHPPTFWPLDRDHTLPFNAFNSFNFPHDNSVFDHYSNRELLIATAIHQGRSMAPLSRLLARERKGGGSDTVIANLRTKLRCAEDEKQKLIQERTVLTSTNESLQQKLHSINELDQQRTQELDNLKQQISELQQQKTDLQQQNSNLQQQQQQQQKQTEELRLQNEKLVDKAKENIVSFRRNFDIITKLEAEVEVLKKRASEVTPEQRQQIIEEYQGSDELQEAIVEEYGKGFEAAKAKVIKAGLDPSQIFSESEDDEADP